MLGNYLCTSDRTTDVVVVVVAVVVTGSMNMPAVEPRRRYRVKRCHAGVPATRCVEEKLCFGAASARRDDRVICCERQRSRLFCLPNRLLIRIEFVL